MTDQTTRYRHRTPEVEAVQWTGNNADALRAFCGPDFDEIELDDRTEDPDESAAVREGKHGTWRGLKPGDWVVKLDVGLYEFAAADFAEQYEPAVPAPATDRTALRNRIAEALMQWAESNNSPQYVKVRRPDTVVQNAYSRADAVLAVLPATVDRGAVLREAADELGRMDYDTDSNDYGYDEYRDAWNGGVMDGADLLRRLAEAQQDETRCTCGDTACESALCDCDSAPCPVDHAREARQEPTQDGTVPLSTAGLLATLITRRAEHAEAALGRMRDRLEVSHARVRALHKSNGSGECQHCHHSAPCPTVCALSTESIVWTDPAPTATAGSGQPETDES